MNKLRIFVRKIKAGLPGIRTVARFGYDRFADLLYGWNRRQGRW